MRINVSLHDIRHAAHHQIGLEQSHHGIVHRRRNGGACLEVAAQHVQRLFLHAVRHAEFLKIQRVHAQLLFESNGIRCNLTGFNTKQRAGFHIVETSVLHKEFDGRACRRTFLNLIEQDQGVAWFQGNTQVCREAFDDAVRIKCLLEYRRSLRVLHKVQFGKATIAMPSEFANERGFADLTRSSDHQRLVRTAFFPILKIAPSLAFQHVRLREVASIAARCAVALQPNPERTPGSKAAQRNSATKLALHSISNATYSAT